MKKNLSNIIKAGFIGATFFGFALTVGATGTWTAPTGTAPSGNVDAPINVGSTLQTKIGALSIGDSSHANGIAVFGNSALLGHTDIGPFDPCYSFLTGTTGCDGGHTTPAPLLYGVSSGSAMKYTPGSSPMNFLASVVKKVGDFLNPNMALATGTLATDALHVNGNSSFNGDTLVSGDTDIVGSATIESSLYTAGSATIGNNLFTMKDIFAGDHLFTTGVNIGTPLNSNDFKGLSVSSGSFNTTLRGYTFGQGSSGNGIIDAISSSNMDGRWLSLNPEAGRDPDNWAVTIGGLSAFDDGSGHMATLSVNGDIVTKGVVSTSESHFSNGHYSDPDAGTAFGLKATSIATGAIYVAGQLPLYYQNVHCANANSLTTYNTCSSMGGLGSGSSYGDILTNGVPIGYLMPSQPAVPLGGHIVSVTVNPSTINYVSNTETMTVAYSIDGNNGHLLTEAHVHVRGVSSTDEITGISSPKNVLTALVPTQSYVDYFTVPCGPTSPNFFNIYLSLHNDNGEHFNSDGTATSSLMGAMGFAPACPRPPVTPPIINLDTLTFSGGHIYATGHVVTPGSGTINVVKLYEGDPVVHGPFVDGPWLGIDFGLGSTFSSPSTLTSTVSGYLGHPTILSGHTYRYYFQVGTVDGGTAVSNAMNIIIP